MSVFRLLQEIVECSGTLEKGFSFRAKSSRYYMNSGRHLPASAAERFKHCAIEAYWNVKGCPRYSHRKFTEGNIRENRICLDYLEIKWD
jgi:hypothetical protein